MSSEILQRIERNHIETTVGNGKGQMAKGQSVSQARSILHGGELPGFVRAACQSKVNCRDPTELPLVKCRAQEPTVLHMGGMAKASQGKQGKQVKLARCPRQCRPLVEDVVKFKKRRGVFWADGSVNFRNSTKCRPQIPEDTANQSIQVSIQSSNGTRGHNQSHKGSVGDGEFNSAVPEGNNRGW